MRNAPRKPAPNTSPDKSIATLNSKSEIVETSSMRAEIEILLKEKVNLGHIIADNNNEIKELKERISMYEKTKENFIKDKGIVKLKEELKTYTEKYENLVVENNKLIEEHKDCKSSNEILKHYLDDANEFKSIYESKNKELTLKNNELESKVKEFQSNLEEKNKCKNELKNCNQILESKLEMQRMKNIENENVIKKFENDIEKLRTTPGEEIDDERDLKSSQ